MKKKYIFIMIIITAIILSLSFTTNYWNRDIIGIDSSVFVKIGEEMHEGKIPYRDIFDHKGPLLYFINYIGNILPNYIILYCIELIFLVLDLLIMYKISKYITNDERIAFISTLGSISPIIIILQGGNFAEEYALPFILYALYIFIKKDIKTKDYIYLGISLGAVILLRANMIPIWLVGYFFITIKLLYKKEFKEFFKTICFSIVGLIIIIIPFIIYLVINDAFNEFISQYIIFNMKYSSANASGFLETIKFMTQNDYGNKYLTEFVIILNIILLIKNIKDKNKFENLIFSLFFIILSVIVVIMPNNLYWHYAIILIPCYIIPISYFLELFKMRKCILLYIQIIIIVISISVLLAYKKIDFDYGEEIYICSEYIKSISNKNDDVLVLGNRCIIYLLSERTTNCKYIYQFPPILIDEKIKFETSDYICSYLPDFIVYMDDYEHYFEKILDNLLEEGKYKLDMNHGYPILIKEEEN